MCGYSFGEPPLGSLGWGPQTCITIIVKAIFEEMSEHILTGWYADHHVVWASFLGSWQKQILVEREPFCLSCSQVLYGNLPRLLSCQAINQECIGEKLTDFLASLFSLGLTRIFLRVSDITPSLRAVDDIHQREPHPGEQNEEMTVSTAKSLQQLRGLGIPRGKKGAEMQPVSKMTESKGIS